MTGVIAALGTQVFRPPVTISSQNILASDNGPVSAFYNLANDRKVYSNAGELETWLPSGSTSAYDVRATRQSGAQGSGTYGTWVNLASSQFWSVLDSTSNGSAVVSTILIEISLAGQASTIASATIVLRAFAA